MNFGEVITAMVTPFNNDGEIDYKQLSMLIEHLINNGTDALVVAGTTGESPTLTIDEKEQLYKYVAQVVHKRIPIIAGTGTYSTTQSIQLTKKAQDAGVDGIMAVTPYYNKPNQQGLYEHFKAIASSTKLPVMLYNVPGRSVINLDATTVIKLSKIPNITSMKEASGNLSQAAEIIEHTPEYFTLYSGDDHLTLPILAIGGNGVVSVAAHIIGNELKQMINYYLKGKPKSSSALHRKILPVMNKLFSAPSPVPVKTALKLTGIHVGSVRLPLVPLTIKEEETLKQIIQT